MLEDNHMHKSLGCSSVILTCGNLPKAQVDFAGSSYFGQGGPASVMRRKMYVTSNALSSSLLMHTWA
jgi:hypothetical protein